MINVLKKIKVSDLKLKKAAKNLKGMKDMVNKNKYEDFYKIIYEEK